jgi:hypothetical protein
LLQAESLKQVRAHHVLATGKEARPTISEAESLKQVRAHHVLATGKEARPTIGQAESLKQVRTKKRDLGHIVRYNTNMGG